MYLKYSENVKCVLSSDFSNVLPTADNKVAEKSLNL